MKQFYSLLFCLICSLSVYAQPTTNASTPPMRDAGDVISIYGDSYSSLEGVNYDPNWGQSGHMMVNVGFDPGTGDTILAYPNFNYQGTEFSSQDATQMENLHIDIWVPAGTNRLVKVSPIDNSGGGLPEVLVEVPLVPGQWNSVDLPQSAFSGMVWNSVFQMKFDGQFNADGSQNTDPFDIYLDNIYFWKSATAVGSDATLSDLQVDGASIPGFSPGVTDYTFGLASGSTDVPQITLATTNDSNASSTITQATTIPGDATVDVTSANGNVMATYTVSFKINAPSSSPPAPTQDAENVVSLFSDAYTTVENINYDPNWGQSGHMQVNPMFDPGTGDFALAYPSFNYQGTEFDAQSLASMEFLHIDIWVPVGTDRLVKVSPVNTTGSGVIEALVEVDFVGGTWASVDIPKSAFGGMSWQSINQFKFDGQFNGDGSANVTPFDIYLDNIYFWKNATGAGNEPTTAAPDPTTPESDVISMFSDVYTDVPVDTWNTTWSEATFEDVSIAGNPTKKYTSLGFNGISTESMPLDASSMLTINMDIWSPNMTAVKVKLVDFLGDGFEGGNGDTEAELTLPVTQGQWMSVSIPLSDFSAAGMTSFSDLNQYIISSEPFGSGILFVDNVYFSKMPTSSNDIEEDLSKIKIYPNPAPVNGVLNVSEDVKQIEIISLNGQIIRSSTKNTIDLQGINSGTYIARITSNNSKTKMTKVIIN